MRQRRRWAAALAAGLALVPAGAADAAKRKQAPSITVMTRNVYLGGDIFRPVTATAGKAGLEALVAFGNANALTRRIVDQTSFPTRSELIANEVAKRKPDLIGLQEVALWRSGPFDLSTLGQQTATKVDYDFLEILLADLKAAGTPYQAISVQEEADVEGPAFDGPDPAADPNARNVRLTMHDVILKRRASKVKVLKRGSDNYEAKYSISLSGIAFDFVRGYNFADVKLGKKKLRFINTHLESATSRVADAQAAELLDGPVREAGRKPVIVVCDCNSDPLDASVKPDDVPHYTAYRRLTKRLNDQWLRFAPASRGWTSGLSETVNDPDASGFDHRIDLILARRANGKAMKSVKGWIVGRQQGNRSPEGLWPSDHAGVVMKLRP